MSDSNSDPGLFEAEDTTALSEVYEKFYEDYDPPPIEKLRGESLFRQYLREVNTVLRHVSGNPSDTEIPEDLDDIDRPPFEETFKYPLLVDDNSIIDDTYNHYPEGMVTPDRPMINLLLYARARGMTLSATYDYLNDNPDKAKLLGFDTLPNKSTVYRAENNRFEFEEEELLKLTERYVYRAIRGGLAIPDDVTQWVTSRYGADPSEPTPPDYDIESRINAVKIILKEDVFPQVLPHLGLRRGPNTTHDREVFYGYLAQLARNRWKPASGSTLTAYDLDVDVPSSRTLNSHIKKFDLPTPQEFQEIDASDVELIDKFRRANDALFELASDHELIEADSIAIDTTNWRWYSEEAPWNLKITPDQNTSTAWQFISTSLVNTEGRFVIETLPVHTKSALPELSEALIDRVQAYLNPEYVYFDREFYTGDVVRVCRSAEINYLIQAKETGEVGRLIRDVRENDKNAKVKRLVDFADVNPPPDAVVVRVHPDAVGNDDNSRVAGYLTDINSWDPDIHDLHYGFNDRWAIESVFDRIKNRFLPLSEAADPRIRIFYYLTGVLFYNMHRLTRLLLEESAPNVRGGVHPTGLDFLTALAEIGLVD